MLSTHAELAEDDYFNDLSQQVSNPISSFERTSSAEGGLDADGIPKVKRIACVLCRKRKLRCDGQRPSCGTCARLAHECGYDEIRRKSGPKRGYVKALEARLGVFFAVRVYRLYWLNWWIGSNWN